MRSASPHDWAKAGKAAATYGYGIAAIAAGLILLLVFGPSVAQASGAPEISNAWVIEVTASSASIHVRVNPNGLSTKVSFEYINDTGYRDNLSAQPPRDGFDGAASLPSGGSPIGSGVGFLEDFEHLGQLEPGTVYDYRVRATNSAAPTGVLSAVRQLETHQISSFSLPDERVWEMVSPVAKNGGGVQGFGGNAGGDVLQAASNGEAVTFSSSTSFGESAQGAPVASQYISRRSSTGWSTENITLPTLSGSYGEEPEGVPYRLFSTDLGRGLVLNGAHCRTSGVQCPVANPPLPGTDAPAGYQNYYLRDDEAGSFTALLTPSDAEFGTPAKNFSVTFLGASPDLRHIVLSSCSALTPGAFEEVEGEGCDSSHPNLYEWSGGTLVEINFTEDEILPTPPAVLAAQSGAISANGQRAYFNDPEDGYLFLREIGAPVRSIAGAMGEAASFQAASADGSVAFFSEGETLYRYSVQAGESEPIAAEVKGVLGASEDGSFVYYQTTAGLFRWQSGTVTEIAPGATVAEPGDWPSASGTARVSDDGSHLLFTSSASLTGYENLGYSEVYLYSAATSSSSASLTCVSCNPTGERPIGASTIPGAEPNGHSPSTNGLYKPRVLSADGKRVFFDSEDALSIQDTDEAPDVYEWEANGVGRCTTARGCVGLISSGRSEAGSSVVDASVNGSDVFFLTAASLVSSDPGGVDLYDAREAGGFTEPPPPLACDSDECSPLPSEPEDPTPGTELPGPGNLPAKKTHRHHHRKKRHSKGHHRRAGKHGGSERASRRAEVQG